MINDETKEIKINTLGELLDFVETEEKAKLLIDYITNLQQENQDLSRMCELYGKSLYNAELTDYKSRCEKAVKYINNNTCKSSKLNYKFMNISDEEIDDLLNILNGRSDE